MAVRLCLVFCTEHVLSSSSRNPGAAGKEPIGKGTSWSASPISLLNSYIQLTLIPLKDCSGFHPNVTTHHSIGLTVSLRTYIGGLVRYCCIKQGARNKTSGLRIHMLTHECMPAHTTYKKELF